MNRIWHKNPVNVFALKNNGFALNKEERIQVASTQYAIDRLEEFLLRKDFHCGTSFRRSAQHELTKSRTIYKKLITHLMTYNDRKGLIDTFNNLFNTVWFGCRFHLAQGGQRQKDTIARLAKLNRFIKNEILLSKKSPLWIKQTIEQQALHDLQEKKVFLKTKYGINFIYQGNIHHAENKISLISKLTISVSPTCPLETDVVQVNKTLISLIKALSEYPDEFVQSKDFPKNFILIKATRLTNRFGLSVEGFIPAILPDFVAVSTNLHPNESNKFIHHEIFHYFDIKNNDLLFGPTVTAWNKIKNGKEESIFDYASSYGKTNAFEDRATIAGLLFSDKVLDKENLQNQMRLSDVFRKKVELITGCMYDSEKKIFLRTYTPEEIKKKYGINGHIYYANWSAIKGRIWMDAKYWNKKLFKTYLGDVYTRIK